MTFTLNRQSYEPKIGDIKVAPPFGIIKLNNTCKTSNKYLQLPEDFGKHSHFERSDPLQELLKLLNISQFSIWNDSKAEFEKFRPTSLPYHLSGLKEIPMQSFLRETRAYKTVNVDDNQNNNSWTFVAIIIAVSALAVIVIVWLMTRKHNCYLTQIIGKRQANMHDLEGVNVKQTPSNGKDIEMSALPDSLISSAEDAEDCVAKFTSLVRARD